MWSEEEKQRLYNAVFRRKSVRKYSPEPLGREEMAEVKAQLDKLFALQTGSSVAFRVVDSGQLKGIISAKAPHFLILYAAKEEASLIDGAFRLQQMDLWLSANGMGCCWLGMPKPGADVQEEKGLPYAVALAFGRPAEPLYREAVGEFKRKPLSEITDIQGMEQLLEPVRLAPSATNRQPWYLTGSSDGVALHCRQASALSKKMLGDMPLMDMGIALCHLWLAMEQARLFAGFVREEQPAASPNHHNYIWTARKNA